MKRTALIAIMIAALAFGAAGFAVADFEDVLVTATVNPAFDMSIDKNAVNFAGVDVDAAYSDAANIRVRSNKAWDFSKSEVVDPLLVPVLTEGTDVAPATGIARGVHPIVASYDLDLTIDAAWDLEADTPYTATYTYTAVQQP